MRKSYQNCVGFVVFCLSFQVEYNATFSERKSVDTIGKIWLDDSPVSEGPGHYISSALLARPSRENVRIFILYLNYFFLYILCTHCNASGRRDMLLTFRTDAQHVSSAYPSVFSSTLTVFIDGSHLLLQRWFYALTFLHYLYQITHTGLRKAQISTTIFFIISKRFEIAVAL